MGADDEAIDLRERGGVPAHTYAYYKLRDLALGESCDVLVEEEPTLLMESVSHQLRHAIHWRVMENGPPLWRVHVQRRDDVAPTTLVDVLERDHLRLDRLFAAALHRVNDGDVAPAATYLQEFAVGLRRHIHVENDILAPAFVGPRDPLGGDPTSIMLHEHEQILEQVELLESYFAGASPEPGEVAPLFALLSGQLAKHEAREELNLFPNWNIAIRHAPAGSEQKLIEHVLDIYGGSHDDKLGLIDRRG